jgi:hypothetical protein
MNFRPTALPEPLLPLRTCFDVVQRTTVGLRGWNYPYVPTSSDDSRGIDYLDQCVQCWSSWRRHLEFWRFYTSEQFLHYIALAEDWSTDPHSLASSTVPDDAPDVARLGVLSATWLAAETFEFLSRLAQRGFYKSGVEVSITLNNTTGRHLYIDEPMRVPFAESRVTHAGSISYKKTISAAAAQQPTPLAKDFVNNLFDRFGWQPNPSQLDADIARLYQLRMGSD